MNVMMHLLPGERTGEWSSARDRKPHENKLARTMWRKMVRCFTSQVELSDTATKQPSASRMVFPCWLNPAAPRVAAALSQKHFPTPTGFC